MLIAPKWLKANSSKMVKAVDFKFDVPVPRDMPDLAAEFFSEMDHGQGHVTP